MRILKSDYSSMLFTEGSFEIVNFNNSNKIIPKGVVN